MLTKRGAIRKTDFESKKPSGKNGIGRQLIKIAEWQKGISFI